MEQQEAKWSDLNYLVGFIIQFMVQPTVSTFSARNEY
mgnify:CR=1 FL=1